VDETIVVIMNVLDKDPELPTWLVTTISGAMRDSDPALVRYFSGEVKKFAPGAMQYFTERIDPVTRETQDHTSR
jgi:hypothetical protein